MNQKELRQIETELRQQLLTCFRVAVPKIEVACREVLKKAIENSETYQSLTSFDGQLRKEFGIEDTRLVDDIVRVWVNGLTAKLKAGKALSITVNAVPSHLLDVVGHPSGSFRSENGYLVEWANWLLLIGNRIAVYDFYYKEPNSFELSFSRAGGFMRGKQGATWTVPSQFAGTVDDNFITKICDSISSAILQTMQREL